MRVAPQASDWDPFVGQLLSFLAMVTLDHDDVTFAEQADTTRPDNGSEFGYLHERMSGQGWEGVSGRTIEYMIMRTGGRDTTQVGDWLHRQETEGG